MKYLLIFTFAALGLWDMQAQVESGIYQGQYQKNLTYKGPYPLIVSDRLGRKEKVLPSIKGYRKYAKDECQVSDSYKDRTINFSTDRD